MEEVRDFGFPPVGEKRKAVEAELALQQTLMDHMLVRALEAHESSDYAGFDSARIIYGETKTKIRRMEERLQPGLKEGRLAREASTLVVASAAAIDFNVGKPQPAKPRNTDSILEIQSIFTEEAFRTF